MNKGRLLVIGINYAPEQTGIAVSTTGLVEGLAQRGWEVTVITGIPHYPAWRPGPIPPMRPNASVRVIRRLHYVPPPQSIAGRAAYEASWVASCPPKLVERREVDLMVGVIPSLGGGFATALAAMRTRVPFVLMFQDLLGRAAQQSRFRHTWSIAAGLEAAEVFLARRAAGVAVVAEGFRSRLAERGVPAHRIHRVRNPVRMGPRGRPRREVRRQLRWLEDEFVVLHSANMGPQAGPRERPLWRALYAWFAHAAPIAAHSNGTRGARK